MIDKNNNSGSFVSCRVFRLLLEQLIKILHTITCNCVKIEKSISWIDEFKLNFAALIKKALIWSNMQ